MFDNKLFSQYYPLKTEKDKDAFLISNLTELRRVAEKLILNARGDILARENKYYNRMKCTVSVFGNLKPGNMIHNQTVMQQMARDKYISRAEDTLSAIEFFAEKLLLGEYDKITIEEANDILAHTNSYTRRKWIFATTSIVLIVAAILYLSIFR